MEDGQLILSGRPRQKPEIHGSIYTSQGRFGFGVGFISDHRTASQLLSQREAARMVKNFVQPIILALAYGTCASAKISCHSAGPGGPGAWLYAQLRHKFLPWTLVSETSSRVGELT